MRTTAIGVGLGLILLSTGCDRWVQQNDRNVITRLPSGTPRADQLVTYLNQNAQRVRSLESIDVDIDAKQDGTAIGLSGTVACQKPGSVGAPANFRMQARMLGKTEVDIGSNGQEFWYWIARAPQPYVYHCDYTDFRAGKARMPFPFQPEWIVEALGVAEYDPLQKYEVREGKTHLELIERSTSPQGQPVQKVTLFNRGQTGSRTPQVVGRMLQDASGKEICSAHVSEVQTDSATGAVVPKVVRMRWPQEKMEMTLTLKDVRVNAPIDDARSSDLFSRRRLTSMPGYDLARGPDGASTSIQPAGGIRK